MLEKEKNSDESEVVYGYDDKENLNTISITDENNVENKNKIVYKYGLPVSYSDENRTYYFSYNHKRQLTGISGNQQNGYTKSYYEPLNAEKTISTTYNMRELFMDDKYSHKYYADGRIKEEYYKYISENAYNPVLDKKIVYSYDSGAKLNNVIQIQDNYSNTTSDFIYDNLDRITEHKKGLLKQNLEYNDIGTLSKEIFSFKNAESDEDWSEIYVNKYDIDYKGIVNNITNGGVETRYKYDILKRKNKKETVKNGNVYVHEEYGYYKNGDRTTDIINNIKYFKNKKLYKQEIYTYDKNGNIISLNDNGRQVKTYTYDRVGRLIKEKNIDLNKEICYTYDEQGNILSKTVDGVEKRYLYAKGNSNYYDTTSQHLVQVGEESIVSDFVGNPISYLGASLTWTRLNLLNSYSKNGVTANFVYDKDKLLTKKTVGDVVTDYI